MHIWLHWLSDLMSYTQQAVVFRPDDMIEIDCCIQYLTCDHPIPCMFCVCCRMSCLLVLLCSSGLCAVVWFLRDLMVAVLTQDLRIQQELKRVLPVVVAAIICDGQVAVLNGLLRASGRQGKGAFINWASYWVLGLPVSYFLAFKGQWGVYGLRVGLTAAAACQALVLHVIAACKFDWDREVERAKELVGVEHEPVQEPLLSGWQHGEESGGHAHAADADITNRVAGGPQEGQMHHGAPVPGVV
eukprot:GHUV01052003.1.p1 GENE.GHUV01052003.1~~GHUV01052003.1.p1  ORF type:complete len:244 (+),score=64.57 GHUV01052003.1:446-1177(+)